jgi:hypothetical protein
LSLTLCEEHKPRVFLNRMLRKIFDLKKDEIRGGWIHCIMKGFMTLLLTNYSLK